MIAQPHLMTLVLATLGPAFVVTACEANRESELAAGQLAEVWIEGGAAVPGR